MGSLLFAHPRDASAGASHDAADWVRDHEALSSWLDSIPEQDRPAFLMRLALLAESLMASPGAALEPDAVDRACSYAILMEYAAARGVSPAELAWTLGAPRATAPPELSVDAMLADAAGRRGRSRPVREVRAGETIRANRGLTLASKLPGRGVESRGTRRADVRTISSVAAPGRVG